MYYESNPVQWNYVWKLDGHGSFDVCEYYILVNFKGLLHYYLKEEISLRVLRFCITCLHICAKGQFGVAKVLPIGGSQSWTILLKPAYQVIVAVSSIQTLIWFSYLQGVHPVVFVYTFFYYPPKHNNYWDLIYVSSVKWVY
jgi:hypothetical protein